MTESPPPAAGSSPAPLRTDPLAGLTAASVVLPKAMAYATVAGLPVSVGLATAFVPMIVDALLGTSRVLSASATATLAILAATPLGLVRPDGDPGRLLTATANLTVLTGALLVAASVLRLGFVANFVSVPVLTGFKAGIGVAIVIDQVPKLLGVHFAKEGLVQGPREPRAASAGGFAEQARGRARGLGAALAMERVRPHSPAPLLVVGAAILVS